MLSPPYNWNIVESGVKHHKPKRRADRDTQQLFIPFVLSAYYLLSICHSNDIGDEFHYVMMCSFFNNERKNTCHVIVRWRRTDNTMAKRKSTKGQTMIYKTYT